VVIPDEMPPELKMDAKLAEALKPFLAKDADIAKLNTAFDAAMAEDSDDDEDEEDKKKKAADKKARDSKRARDKKARDEKGGDDKDDDKAKDEEVDHRKDFESEKDKQGKDAIIAAAKDAGMVTGDEMNAAIKASTEAAVKRVEALHIARAEVESICGPVNLTSAEEVYGFALDHMKVDRKDVPPAAFRALVNVAKQKTAPAPHVAFDAAAAGTAATVWPGLAQIH
jgi:hypothetical protein